MNLDLLALLESIVSGFVSFFYSLVGSAYAAIRAPLRGPVRLYRRYKNPKARQIGALTFVCMSFFVAYYFFLKARGWTAEGLGQAAQAAASNIPKMTAVELWPVLAASLASTIIVDAALKLWLDARLKGRRARRDLVLGATLYALFWTAPFAVVASIYAGVLIEGGSWLFMFFPLEPYLGIGAMLLLAIPAARILSSGAYRSKKLATGLSVLLAICALMLAAGYGGLFVGMALSAQYVDTPKSTDECQPNCA